MKKEKIKEKDVDETNVNSRAVDSGDGSNEGAEDGSNSNQDHNPDSDLDPDSDSDSEGRPNRGTGSSGVKRPGGTGGKDQYSLTNPDEQEA